MIQNTHKKNRSFITAQWLPDIKMFRISYPNLDVLRDLEWCKKYIDAHTILPHNWDWAIKHPEQVFYI